MKTYVVRLLVIVVSLTAPIEARAGGCGYGYGYPYYTPYYTPTYEVKKFTVLEFVQPYFVGFAAPYVAPPVSAGAGAAQTTASAPASSPCDVKIAAMEAKYAALEAKFNAVVSAASSSRQPEASSTTPKPAATPTQVSILASQRCASCHDIKVAAEKGGGLALSRGGAALKLDDKQVGAVIREVTTHHMPKDGNELSNKEMNQLLDEVLVMVAKK